jgi:hypothetical protein
MYAIVVAICYYAAHPVQAVCQFIELLVRDIVLFIQELLANVAAEIIMDAFKHPVLLYNVKQFLDNHERFAYWISRPVGHIGHECLHYWWFKSDDFLFGDADWCPPVVIHTIGFYFVDFHRYYCLREFTKHGGKPEMFDMFPWCTRHRD